MIRQLSVKQRVVIWYAGVLLLLAVLVFFTFRWSSMRQSDAYAKDTLRRACDAAQELISLEEGFLQLDEDLEVINYANLLVYDKGGAVLLYGRQPDFTLPLEEEAARQIVGEGGRTWCVYDSLYTLSSERQVWLRAYLSMDSIVTMEGHVADLFLWMLLPLALLGLLGGYLVTRRAFRPMVQMADTAEQIAEGADLSARIGLEGKDEFAQLSQVFDAMLARLQNAFEQEKRFVSDASHELRTPLTVIQAQCDAALLEQDPVQQQRSLEAIKKQADKMTKLVRELLTLSRMDAHTQTLRLERVDLCELAEAVAEELASQAEKKKIHIQTSFQPGCMLRADETLMLRLLINLLSNAIQFGTQGGHVGLMIWREGQGGDILGRVEDDGIGIAKEDLPHIWERFWQADPSRTGEDGSSGLGLPMVQWIVQAHGGQIQAESKPGQGTKFTFRLPCGGENE